jgi:8-oxo-dGTP pyrophosphatase MutT (NUDIX family)
MIELNINLSNAYIAQQLNQIKANSEIQRFADASDLLRKNIFEPKPAAVLIPLLTIENDWHILYTRRNDDLPEHSGQVAFPGGRADPSDTSPEDTALREANEEIGVASSDVEILGRLPNYLTITNYQVAPVVGKIPWPYPFILEKEEVSRVFTIPFTWLSDSTHYEERCRVLSAHFTPITVIYYKPYNGEVLWGASARMTLMLLNILGFI